MYKFAFFSKYKSSKFFRKRYWLYISLIPLGVFLLFLTTNWCFPLKVSISYSKVILAKDSTVLHTYLSKDDKWRLKTELSEIIPQLQESIVYKEDKYFYYHFGINFFAIGRAFLNNIWQGKTTSGASTITMQVARLLEPKQRTYWNKAKEMFRALQLEWYYSKDEILQLYLNLVPYGSNIEGVKSAALLYFNKMPQQLSLAQIITLTIIPNRPTSLTLGQSNHFIKKERNKWLKRLANSRIFPEKYIKNALEEHLHFTRREAPKFAPHFCQILKKTYPKKDAIYTTLNFAKQQKVEKIAFNYIQRMSLLNIHNAAILVINNKTKAVEAYVGSADFEDKFNDGEVDGVQGIRSPGSTLKPLVYALAIDKGLLTPETVLYDVPENFRGFEPENFYQNFTGKVSVEEALIQSLNIPAVQTLEKIGIDRFIQKLKQANFEQIAKDEKKLGLSLVLGGCGVNLEDLTTLFSAFANEGHFQELRYAENTPKEKGFDLFSPEAAFCITEILSKAQRPDLLHGFENTYHIPKIAWKTGTSYGRRDAWSIGYNARYTVGVWVGNFSGEGVNHLVGSTIATPLLFEVFNTLDYNSKKEWFKAPPNLKVRWVCSETGDVPNHFCKNQLIDYYIPVISHKKKCQHLKSYKVSLSEDMSYCLTCQPKKGFKTKLYPNLPPALANFYEVQGLKYEKIPPHNPNCTRLFKLEAPIITSPSPNKEYIIDRKSKPKIQLTCKVRSEVKKVYWYINDELLEASKPSKAVFFTPSLGRVRISCSDDKGNTSSVQIRVLYE